MKRGWGFDHIITKKTKKHASADVGFIFIAYNLRRIINMIGTEQLVRQILQCWLKKHVKQALKRLYRAFQLEKNQIGIPLDYLIQKLIQRKSLIFE